MKNRKTGRQCLPLTVCGLVLLVSHSTVAQQASPAEPGTQQPAAVAQPQSQGEQRPSDEEKKKQEERAKRGTSGQRTLFLVPNFQTVEGGSKLPPLTAGQKFKLVARGTFDPFQFGYYAVLAGIGQAGDAESGYGQGAQGYGKRYGAIAVDSTIENFTVGAVLPSLLHQDPRYYRMGSGSFGQRAWYAMTRVFVIRGDSGHQQFNASEIFGSAIAAGISTYSYHPEQDQKIRNVASTWGTQLGSDVFGYTMKEFWPDIRRHIRKKGSSAAKAESGEG